MFLRIIMIELNAAIIPHYNNKYKGFFSLKTMGKRSDAIYDLFFRKQHQVIVCIDHDKVDNAEEIFRKYNGHQLRKTKVGRDFKVGEQVFRMGSKKPNKTLLHYIVDSRDFPKVGMELGMASIIGNRHDRFYTMPHKLFDKLRSRS